jgi:hypothetical protein
MRSARQERGDKCYVQAEKKLHTMYREFFASTNDPSARTPATLGGVDRMSEMAQAYCRVSPRSSSSERPNS